MRITRVLALLLMAALVGQIPVAAAPEEAVVVDGITFDSWTDYFTSDYFRENGKRCGTPEVTDVDFLPSGEFRVGTPADCSYNNTNPSNDYAPANGTIDIPVVVHIIAPYAGHPADFPDWRVHDQIRVLNEDFNAIAGSNGAPGTNCNVRFCLATVDPQGNPTTGITRDYNSTWFADSGGYYNTLNWNAHRYLNIYSLNPGSGILGYVPFLPQQGSVGSTQDRVVILYSAFGTTGTAPPYNLGRTTTHEVGHYLGQFHTFQGGCATATPPGCYTTGDRICDTESEQAPEYACSTAPSCGTPDPIHNYMDYSYDSCMWEYTFEQARRIRCTLEHYRPNLGNWHTCDFVAVGDPSSQIGAGSLFSLQNAPNPFRPTTEISFELGEAGMTTLQVMDVSGRIIKTLTHGALPVGTHNVTWDGTDDASAQVAPGVYFYRLDTNGIVQTRRMVLLK